MSDPGPSKVPKQEIPDEVEKFYGDMTDAVLVVHTKALMSEVTRRNSQNHNGAPLLALAAPPLLTTQDTEELPRVRLIDPKHEYTDEQYLVVHERASGVEYHPETSSYTWNPRLMDTDGIRRTNELNNYGRPLLQNQQKTDPPPPPPPVPSSSSSGTKTRNKRAPAAAKTKTTTITTSKTNNTGKKAEDPVVDCSCSICNARFTSLRVLLEHRGEKHSLQDMLTCHFCERRFPSRNIFVHLCQEYKVFQCPVCLYCYASDWHRDHHRCEGRPVVPVVPTAPAKKVQVPPVEVKEELVDPEYDEHEQPERKKAPPVVQNCGKCGKKYTSPWWFERHEDMCTGPLAPPPPSKTVGLKLKCEICLRVYSCLYWYGRHKETCNSDTPTPAVVLPSKATPSAAPKEVRCKNCDKQFQHEISLGYHARYCSTKVILPSLMPKLKNNTVEMEEEEEEEMTVAAPKLREEEVEEEEDEDEEEDDKSGLKLKMQCSICKLEFPGVSNLLSHRKNHHGMTAMLTCGICDKNCGSLSSIRRHISQEYEIYRCKKCGRNCQDSTTLLAHDCSKPYTIRDPHLSRLQHGAALKCSSCHASFTTSTLLYNHRMTCELLQQHAKRHSPVTKRTVSVNRLPSVGGSRPGTRSGSRSTAGSKDSVPAGCIVVKMTGATSGSATKSTAGANSGSTTKSMAGVNSGSATKSMAGANSGSSSAATELATKSTAGANSGSAASAIGSTTKSTAGTTSGSSSAATGSTIKSTTSANSGSATKSTAGANSGSSSAATGSTIKSTAGANSGSATKSTAGATSGFATKSMAGATSGSATKSMAGLTSGSTISSTVGVTPGSVVAPIASATSGFKNPGSSTGATSGIKVPSKAGVTSTACPTTIRFMAGATSGSKTPGSIVVSTAYFKKKSISGATPASISGATSGSLLRVGTTSAFNSDATGFRVVATSAPYSKVAASMTGAISGVTSASTSSATGSMTGPITGSLLRSIIGSTSSSNSASTSDSTFGSIPRSLADATASTTSATFRTTSESMDPGPAPPPPPRTLKRTRAQSVHTPRQQADPNLKCSECAHQSVTLSELALHRQTIHRKPPHSCNFCPRVFRTQRALYDHHMTEIGRWKCSKCNKVVNRKYLLHFHERYCGKKAEPK
ncbi:unnamed protein product [Caenorhabditis brenneri]